MATEPNVNNALIGPCVLYVAPTGTAFPSLATKPNAAAWLAAGFSNVGYTENGVDLITTPAKKDFTPDEAITPIIQKVTGLSVEVKITAWEAHLENMERAVPLSVLSNPGTGIKTLSIGSGNPLKEFALGIQGAGVGAVDGRVITLWRANVVSATSQAYSRKDLTKLAVTFTALTDSSKANTLDSYQIVDFNAGS